YNFKMSTHSEATVHLESDTDEVEINSDSGMCSQQGKENSNDYKCISDLTDDDIRGMEFSIETEATTFYEL
ncbi:hypothetical protein A2U01_0009473, partial [Trifolium medium]|nr:hypothetical protein [Trifolium medium]